MKRSAIIVALLVTAVAVAAQKQAPNLGLIPTPQVVSNVDSSHMVRLDKAKVRYVQMRDAAAMPQAQNPEQAYEISFEPKRITVSYLTEEGRHYADLTLQQLQRLHNEVPSMVISDWPAYRLRGWMDDISRGPVTHQDYRQLQWLMLHGLKYNFCNYYTEHTLYQSEYPDLAPAYADQPRHADEVINLQLFAHAEKTLRVPYYEHLMDSRANFNPDNEATYTFLRSRIAEAYRQMPQSPFFIIDCDETEQLGTGRAKSLVQRKGDEQVYVDHINRCFRIVKEEGSSRVVMWGDIVAKNPAMMRQLPADMTYIMWAYEPLESYDHLIKPFRENGSPFWVAPSLSHSSNMIPAPQRYMTNIANLARDGHRAGAEGLMNTCWDDNGEALFDNCWHGLFWSAEMAWNPLKTSDSEERKQREEQFNQNFDRLFYGKAGLTAQLYAVGALESDADVAEWYTSAALMEPLLNFNPENTSATMLERVKAVERKVAAIEVDSAANPHAHYALQRIKATCQKAVLRYILSHNLEDYTPYAEAYFATLRDLKREYLRLWDQENGEYERYIVCNRYDALAREVLDLDRHVFMEVGNDGSSPLPQVRLYTLGGDKAIYYTLDGLLPDSTATRYDKPFALPHSATIRAITYNRFGEGVVSEQYLLSHPGMNATVSLHTPYSTYKAIYSGGGDNALADGQLGSNSTYADGHWQGYWGDSIDAVLDFGEKRIVHGVAMRFMQNTFDWILSPTSLRLLASDDGEHWHQVAEGTFRMDPRETGMRLKNRRVDLAEPIGTRYLRVVAPNPGPLPKWHPAPGQPSYLFTDEIIVL